MFPSWDSASEQHHDVRGETFAQYYTLWHATERAEVFADQHMRVMRAKRRRQRESEHSTLQRQTFCRIGKQLAESWKGQRMRPSATSAVDVACSAPL